MRIYQSLMADSTRWHRFALQEGDVVITSPSKSGTTWMQHIVTRLVRGSAVLDAPILEISPWLDARLTSEDDVVSRLDAQPGRRVIKTHTPLDGVPTVASVFYVALARHPLDAALSFRDHIANTDGRVAMERLVAADAAPTGAPPARPPDEPSEYLEWWIDNDVAPDGGGVNGLFDYCNSIREAWDRRHETNVRLVHYQQLVDAPEATIADLARWLSVDASTQLVADVASATTIDSLRSTASRSAPHADIGLWGDAEAFFPVGGGRDWASHLKPGVIDRFEQRVKELLPEGAVEWLLRTSPAD